jgi:hypothetical protein
MFDTTQQVVYPVHQIQDRRNHNKLNRVAPLPWRERVRVRVKRG